MWHAFMATIITETELYYILEFDDSIILNHAKIFNSKTTWKTTLKQNVRMLHAKYPCHSDSVL